MKTNHRKKCSEIQDTLLFVFPFPFHALTVSQLNEKHVKWQLVSLISFLLFIFHSTLKSNHKTKQGGIILYCISVLSSRE